jgi:predicted GIY-YIG superfamily endonuclease
MAWLYVLRLKSGALYVGATNDLDARYREHQEGTACRTTSDDPPVELAHSEEFDTFADAHKRELQVKRWSRAKKEALIIGNLRSLKTLSRSRRNC